MVTGLTYEDTAATLLAMLPNDGWRLLGQVAVGPSGVFVIETRGWSGTVEVRDGVLRHDGRARSTAVADTADSASAVGRLLPSLPPELVYGVLCFVRSEPLAGSVGSVVVCSSASLGAALAARPAVLTRAQVRRIAVELGARVPVRPAAPARLVRSA